MEKIIGYMLDNPNQFIVDDVFSRGSSSITVIEYGPDGLPHQGRAGSDASKQLKEDTSET